MPCVPPPGQWHSLAFYRQGPCDGVGRKRLGSLVVGENWSGSFASGLDLSGVLSETRVDEVDRGPTEDDY